MAKAARQVTVLIPGLLGPSGIRQLPEVWRDMSLSALQDFLSRSRRDAVQGKGLERALFASFNLDVRAESDPPVAAVTRQWECRDAAGFWWLRADPVHLRADRDRIVMLGNDLLDLSDDECREMASELNSHFAGEDWHFDAANARRWYLRLGADPGITTEALPEILGRNILPAMPGGPAAGRWRSVMNEVQMVLHSSPVNRSREVRGALAVNSVWFWGGGRLPCPTPRSWSHLWSNDVLSKGLATLTDVPFSSLPPDAEEWLEHDAPGNHLLVIDGLRDKVQVDDVEGWREFLQCWHDVWLVPLWSALRQRRLSALQLLPADGTAFRITAREARRWWVRRRPLAQWL